MGTREPQHGIDLQEISQQAQLDENSRDHDLVTKSRKARNSFNLELSALLNDNDELDVTFTSKGIAESDTRLRENSLSSADTGALTKPSTALEERRFSQPVKQGISFESADSPSVEIPDYSPDFNSESEKIGNLEKFSENNAR